MAVALHADTVSERVFKLELNAACCIALKASCRWSNLITCVDCNLNGSRSSLLTGADCFDLTLRLLPGGRSVFCCGSLLAWRLHVSRGEDPRARPLLALWRALGGPPVRLPRAVSTDDGLLAELSQKRPKFRQLVEELYWMLAETSSEVKRDISTWHVFLTNQSVNHE